MFRMMGRVAYIAIVAALVGGTIFVVVERASGAADDGEGPSLRGRHAGRWQDGADRLVAGGPQRPSRVLPWEQPEGETRGGAMRLGHGGREGHGRFSLGRGIGGLAVTFVQVGLIAVPVAALQRRSRRKLAVSRRLP